MYPINLDSKDISIVVRIVEIARFFKAELHIVYVNDPAAGYRFPADHEGAVSLKVHEVASDELLEGMKIIYAVSKGQLDEEIERYSRDNDIDLIVVGHKHRSKLYSALFDSPDVNIVDAINIPILILPKNK